MARYVCRIRTDRPPADVFAYLSDFRTVAEWDPGAVSSTLIAGEAPGPDAAYEVVTRTNGRELTFRYETTEFAGPTRFTVRGRSFPLTSIDTVTVTPQEGGSMVQYDARLVLPFPLSIGDRFLRSVFEDVGDAAAHGLANALGGEWIR